MLVRRRRGAPLSANLLDALQKWTAIEGPAEVAACLAVTPRTLLNWSKSKPIQFSQLLMVRDQLEKVAGLRPGQDLATAGALHDPIDDIRLLFEEARRLHYGCFRPEAAMVVLQQLECHPGIHAVPVEEMLKMLAVTMSIYRQSSDAADWHFRSCGRRCLELLSRINLPDHGDELAAVICTVAWELVAVTVQRGWAADAVPLLERVNQILDERTLWPHLQAGRGRSIRRLMHWARVVAYERFADVRAFIRKRGSLIEELSARSAYSAVETHNVISQKMTELLRFAFATDENDNAVEYFEEKLHPVLRNLDTLSSNLSISAKQSSLIQDWFTPSTAMHLALQSLLLAVHVRPSNASDITECAVNIARRIGRASDGAILIQTMNPETQDLIHSSKARGTLRPDVLAMFSFVNHISERGKLKLHALAQELLACVEHCRRRVYSINRDFQDVS